MSPSPRTRRAVIAGLAIPTAGALAGCGGVFAEDDAPTPEPYTHLRNRTVYVAATVSLSIPDPIEPVDEPGDAGVVVLPASTDRSAADAVRWIDADRRIALVGTRSQDTWLGWQDSEAYRDAYPDHRGRALSCAGGGSGGGEAATPTDCEPPEVLVAWDPAEGPPTTFRKTWGGTDDPSAEQVFAAIDDAFDDDF